MTSNSTPVSNSGSLSPNGDISSVSIKEKDHSGKNIFLIILVLLLLAGGASAYFFRNDLVNLPILKYLFRDNQDVVVSQDDIQLSETTTTKEGVTQVVASETPEQNLSINIIDPSNNSSMCDNYQCLISAASKCQPMSATISYSGVPFPLFPGMSVAGQNIYTIQKSSDIDKCIIIFSSPTTSLSISDEGRKSALAKKITDAQITAQLQTINDSYKLSAGMQTNCSSSVSAIVSYLEDGEAYMKNGNLTVDVGSDLNGHTTYTTSSGQKLICTDTSPKQPINTLVTITDKECTAQKGFSTTVTSTETACFENQTDFGSIIGDIKIDGKYPQCCAYK